MEEQKFKAVTFMSWLSWPVLWFKTGSESEGYDYFMYSYVVLPQN